MRKGIMTSVETAIALPIAMLSMYVLFAGASSAHAYAVVSSGYATETLSRCAVSQEIVNAYYGNGNGAGFATWVADVQGVKLLTEGEAGNCTLTCECRAIGAGAAVRIVVT